MAVVNKDLRVCNNHYSFFSANGCNQQNTKKSCVIPSKILVCLRPTLIMPTSKIRKAFGAVKDQTSLGLAKVYITNASALDIAVLKATTHDEYPTDERYIDDVLQMVSSNKAYAAASAQSIAKRIGKTRNWIVALKSLMLVLRIFQDGDPYFPSEVLHAMKRGSKIFNLTGFRDDSNSSPWDYTAFVRTFALYLDERLDCFLQGKLQRRLVFKDKDKNNNSKNNKKNKNKGGSTNRRANEPVPDMKPPVLLDRISHWQRLLDRAIATRPTGAAKSNKLVQISLYTIVQESFDLYRDISDGLALLLDSFFHLQYQSCVSAFQTCVKASKQFEELSAFYTMCKSSNVGRFSEYPSVQKISDELVETLQEFLKDQSSFPASARSSPAPSPSHRLLLPAPPPPPSSSSSKEVFPDLCYSEVVSEKSNDEDQKKSEFGSSPGTSLEDFVGFADDQTGTSQSSTSIDQEQEQNTNNLESKTESSGSDCWEHALFETTTTQQDPTICSKGFDSSFLEEQHFINNPFLQDPTELTAVPTVTTSPTDFFSMEPTFQATAVAPTFYVEKSTNDGTMFENDPFESFGSSTITTTMGDHDKQMFDGSSQNLLHEQQLWLQYQNKIIAKHMT